jgi:hypothetical protein
MTANTTFKEFVEEEGCAFSLLEFDSRDYMKLVERFNRVKLKLRAEEEARLRGRAALLLAGDGRSAGAKSLT